MRTVTEQSKGAKGLKVIGVAVTALVIGAWILPSGAQMEGVPVGPVHTDAEIVPDVNAHGTLGVDISFPAVVQDGQYCVAYGIAWGGTAPYSFSWGRSAQRWRCRARSVGPEPDRQRLRLRRRRPEFVGHRCRQ